MEYGLLFWKRRPEKAPQVSHAPEPPLQTPPIAYDIDWFWCDAFGMYFRGWLHCYDRKIESLAIRIGEDTATVGSFQERSDVLPHYPGFAISKDCGFEIYVPSRPGNPPFFVIGTPEGEFSIPIKIPQREFAPGSNLGSLYDQFVNIVNEQKLTVLELGARIVGPISIDNRQTFHGAGRYIGMDVHPAPTVDIVGDAHELSSLVGEGALDALYSIAVLEHLERPWIAAEEMNRALKIGGYVFHSTVHSWPLHEVPNDFWRFSDEGLKVLFGPAFGFEVIAANLAAPVSIYPQIRIEGLLQLPLNPGYAESCILARKVAEMPSRGERLKPDMNERARQYPLRETR